MPEGQKTDTAAKPRSWIARLRGKWVEALIATVIGLIITALLGFFWGIGITKAKTYYAEWNNMSYEDALAEANENVGAGTADVIPFRNADSDQQYIVVITDPPKSKTVEKNLIPQIVKRGESSISAKKFSAPQYTHSQGTNAIQSRSYRKRETPHLKSLILAWQPTIHSLIRTNMLMASL